MIAFAKEEFRLSKRDDSGCSLRETLEVVERMTGKMPEEGLNIHEFPILLWDLWQAFLCLHASRQAGMTANPISEQELACYANSRRFRWEGWQLDTLHTLDRLAMAAFQIA